MGKLENCSHCFTPYLQLPEELPLCKTCSPLFQNMILLFEWLHQPLTWPWLKAHYIPQRFDGLLRLALLAETFHEYAGQFKKHLPQASSNQCYLCPKPLPWRGYTQPICLNCAETLVELKAQQLQHTQTQPRDRGTKSRKTDLNAKVLADTRKPWQEDLALLKVVFKEELFLNETQVQAQLLASKHKS
jgi:hypothetical protein